MIRLRILAVGLILLFACSSLSVAYGFPSGDTYPPRFTLYQGDWYDSWGIAIGMIAGVLPETLPEEMTVIFPLFELAYQFREASVLVDGEGHEDIAMEYLMRRNRKCTVWTGQINPSIGIPRLGMSR
jgi:hypothetical protein